MAYSAKEIIKILLQHGWKLDRVRGSHHVYKNDKLGKSVPIPMHGKAELGKGLYYTILKQCGIDKKDM